MEAAVREKSLVIALLAVGTTLSAACTGVGPLGPTGIELMVTADDPVLGAIGSQTQLELHFPDGMSTTGNETVVWQSSAPAIAIVDANGKVTAVDQGLATITAQTLGLSASTTITVDARIVSTASVRSQQTDSNSGNNTASVTITVQAN